MPKTGMSTKNIAINAFRPRISVLLIVINLTVFMLLFMLMTKFPFWFSSFILTGAFLLIVFVTTGVRYVIAENRLYMKIWMIPMGSVKIAEIISLKRTYNLIAPNISSQPRSLKRLSIGLVGGMPNFPHMLVSPAREQEFIEELIRINPNISVHVPVKKGGLRVWDWDI